jgi:pimeloyl-ACP methyl ester carboxylesterase
LNGGDCGSRTLAHRHRRVISIVIVATEESEWAQVRRHTWDRFSFETRTVTGPVPGVTPVLLVGGAFQRKESWGRIEEYLLEERPVITVDLPRWGSADPLPAECSDFLAAVLYQALTDLGAQKVDLAGGSYGAMIGYGLAQLYPEVVNHLLTMASLTRSPTRCDRPSNIP